MSIFSVVVFSVLVFVVPVFASGTSVTVLLFVPDDVVVLDVLDVDDADVVVFVELFVLPDDAVFDDEFVFDAVEEELPVLELAVVPAPFFGV